MMIFKSITRRIVLLHIIAICVTSVFLPVALYLMLRSAAEELQHRSLRENAELIARYLSVEPDQRLALNLPANLEALFSETYGRYAYSIVNASGQALFSSLKNHGPVLGHDSRASEPTYEEQKGGNVGASIPFKIGDHAVWVQVEQDAEHRDVLIDDIVREFFERVGWITIPILLLLLIIDLTIFRRALNPLLEASKLAASIGPDRTDVRLPLENMPSEIKPLVFTMNQALDRLEEGFRAQREFTADAAHELRTPLSILQARIDTLSDKGTAKELSLDISRMKRVVSQLLDIAELEAFTVGPNECADLREVCVEVVDFVAPMAIAGERQIVFEAPEEQVLVRGNEEVIFRALRNVIENAIKCTPPATVVTIALQPDGTVSVSDHGPGIAELEWNQIFQRFWRKNRSGSSGSGLGLPIVKRIMDAHGGEVTVQNLAPDGCVFRLKFRLSRSTVSEAAASSEPYFSTSFTT